MKLNRIIPTYGNWGGPGWSAGKWNDDPAKTDWSVPPINLLDHFFKQHDRCYQRRTMTRKEADRVLVLSLLNTSIFDFEHLSVTQAGILWGYVYALGAVMIFGFRGYIWPFGDYNG